MSRAITGEIVHVDGGFHCVGGALARSGAEAPLSPVG
jgi:enoyl-[acyl-carrier-protein] reductase (NADH)